MTKFRKSKYSQEIKQKARDFIKEGKSIRETSDEMGIPCQNIRYWVKDLEIKNTNRYSKEKKQEVFDLQEKGFSVKEIVEKTKIPYASVYYWVKKSGAKVNKPQKSKVVAKKPTIKEGQLKLIVGGKKSANIVVDDEKKIDELENTLPDSLEEFEKILALSVREKPPEEEKGKRLKKTFDFWGAVAREQAGEVVNWDWSVVSL